MSIPDDELDDLSCEALYKTISQEKKANGFPMLIGVVLEDSKVGIVISIRDKPVKLDPDALEETVDSALDTLYDYLENILGINGDNDPCERCPNKDHCEEYQKSKGDC